MRKTLSEFVERSRITMGEMASPLNSGPNGAFIVECQLVELMVVASDGEGWEHVSVSTKYNVPTWKQMCFVRDLFWDEEETVIQYHPPKSQYVNSCSTCLHLWKPINEKIPLPPLELV